MNDSWNLLKNALWPAVFWTWVICVSLWVELTSLNSSMGSGASRFSDIVFTGMRLEQIMQDGSSLIINSPKAWLEGDENRLYLQTPELTRKDARDNVFSASSAIGIVTARLSESALPLEFNYLELAGGANAVGKGSSVSSERMLLDCRKRIFFTSNPCQFKKNEMNANMNVSLLYDPLSDRGEQVKDESTIPWIQKKTGDEKNAGQ